MDPFRRRRSLRSTKTVMPIQAKAAPIIRATPVIVSMAQCRSRGAAESCSGPKGYGHVMTAWRALSDHDFRAATSP